MLRLNLAASAVLLSCILCACPAEAAGYPSQSRAHLSPVLGFDADFGGDNVARVFYTDGTTQDIKAGQGIAPAVGLHYQLAAAPVDFAVTVGYKYVTTRASNVDIHIDRVEIKALGTYELPGSFWIDAGPVCGIRASNSTAAGTLRVSSSMMRSGRRSASAGVGSASHIRISATTAT